MADETDTDKTIDPQTLNTELVDPVLDRVKQLDKRWSEMTEVEQRELIQTLHRQANRAIDEVVHRIAADGRDVIQATLKQVTRDGDKIVGKLEPSTTSEYRHEMFDATGSTVLLVVADGSQYRQGAAPEPEPDQHDLVEGPGDAAVADATRAAAE